MKRKIILVDGSNLAFRMFFALSRLTLTSPDGKPSGAIYGFVKLILETINKEKPDNLVVAWDPKGGTFRDKKFDYYKANRPTEMPPELKEQFPKIFEALDYLGIAQYNIKDIEADDIIGTLAKRFSNNKNEVLYLSGDKDLFQLVDENITALYPSTKGGTSVLNREGVMDKIGVYPEQVVDFKAMAGDSSDNIPGVPGVGVKGAANLLAEYKTLENIYKNIDNIKSASVQKKLLDGKQSAIDSQWLATIKTDCDVDYSLETPLLNPDEKKIQKFFAYYNLKSLQKPLEIALNQINIKPIEIEETPKKEAKKIEDFEEVLIGFEPKKTLVEAAKKTKLFSYYISSHSTGIIDISWVDKKHNNTSINIKDNLDELNKFFTSKGVEFTTYDLKNQYKLSTINHLELASNSTDLFLADKLINYSEKTNFEEFLASSNLLPGVSVTTNLLVIHDSLVPKFTPKELKLWKEIESILAPIVGKMEDNGIYIDKEKMQQISADLHKEIAQLDKEIHKEIGNQEININSTQQLSVALAEMGYDLGKKTKTGKYSTKKEILEDLAISDDKGLIQKILDYRVVTKLASTFTDSFLKIISDDGRIHGVYNQIGANTGRFSSTEPNLQNIPIKHPKYGPLIRSTFAAPKGKILIAADYSQIELRVLAHISGDPTLIEAFKKDQDIHARTASEIYEIPLAKITSKERRLGKTLNFALVYMQGPFSTAKQLGIKMSEAKEFIAKYFARFPKVKPLIDSTLEKARKELFVETLWGRRIHFPNINSSNFALKAASERAAFNAMLQGTGTGDITKIAMINIQNKIDKENLPIMMMMQVHDELVFEVDKKFEKEALEIITKEMMLGNPLKVPLKVDIASGKNWAECK